jgi:oxygen-independent coproporphyrinogen-3 oxidase
MDRYVERLCGEIHAAHTSASRLSPAIELPRQADTLYLGGGTPSLLSAAQMQRIFSALSNEFSITPDAEITLECAPGQLDDSALEALLRLGMNRISFGVQSFVDREAAAVGRLHTRALCLAEIRRMQSAGIPEINVDLIAGLPHQTAASWRESVAVAIQSGVPHISIYMLEVDEDSRLGSEMLAEGMRYGAASTPSDDETAAWYGAACEWLADAGIQQYEISNFARPGHSSRHNVKYWQRDPYLGFGLDAHSMLRTAAAGDVVALRLANTDDLEAYLAETTLETPELSVLKRHPHRTDPAPEAIHRQQAFEEAIFLGLRMNRGIDLEALRWEFGERLVQEASHAWADIAEAGLIEREDSRIRLTARGRMASNEVFARLLAVPA